MGQGIGDLDSGLTILYIVKFKENVSSINYLKYLLESKAMNPALAGAP